MADAYVHPAARPKGVAEESEIPPLAEMIAGKTARIEIRQKAPLPLFVLFNPDGSKLKAQLLKLDDEDGETYRAIAEGTHAELVEIMDYLHEGEDALHGPR